MQFRIDTITKEDSALCKTVGLYEFIGIELMGVFSIDKLDGVKETIEIIAEELSYLDSDTVAAMLSSHESSRLLNKNYIVMGLDPKRRSFLEQLGQIDPRLDYLAVYWSEPVSSEIPAPKSFFEVIRQGLLKQPSMEGDVVTYTYRVITENAEKKLHNFISTVTQAAGEDGKMSIDIASTPRWYSVRQAVNKCALDFNLNFTTEMNSLESVLNAKAMDFHAIIVMGTDDRGVCDNRIIDVMVVNYSDVES